MMYLLLVLAILVLGAATLLGVGTSRGGRRSKGTRFTPTQGVVQGLIEPVASLPPVLLPTEPTSKDIESVGFSIALRGYRCDQVDEVLDALSEEIDRLHQVIAQHRNVPVISNTSDSSE